jgi:hypothetical protein
MDQPTTRDGFLLASLLAVAAGLLAVGVQSHTEVRHLIQAVPAILVAILVLHGDPRARLAAVPVFAMWFLIMLGIWLFVLGLAHVLTGNFTRAEIILTLVIGSGCVAGLVRTLRRGPRLGWVTATITLALSGALQVGCVWLSLQPTFARR